ncbi:MAG: hypothetical protein ACJAUP_002724 [Cellvibrionaceae bacterium]|jgi:hypothetical protein
MPFKRVARFKLAIIAHSPKELAQRLKQLIKALSNPAALQELMNNPEGGFLLSINKMDCKLGWVFPSQ